jgi:hypothetical protein
LSAGRDRDNKRESIDRGRDRDRKRDRKRDRVGERKWAGGKYEEAIRRVSELDREGQERHFKTDSSEHVSGDLEREAHWSATTFYSLLQFSIGREWTLLRVGESVGWDESRFHSH